MVPAGFSSLCFPSHLLMCSLPNSGRYLPGCFRSLRLGRACPGHLSASEEFNTALSRFQSNHPGVVPGVCPHKEPRASVAVGTARAQTALDGSSWTRSASRAPSPPPCPPSPSSRRCPGCRHGLGRLARASPALRRARTRVPPLTACSGFASPGTRATSCRLRTAGGCSRAGAGSLPSPQGNLWVHHRSRAAVGAPSFGEQPVCKSSGRWGGVRHLMR